MKQSIVVSVLGEDSPGKVKALSNLVVKHQGCWIESRMASLAGKFAGIVRIDVPDQQFDAFIHELETKDIGLNVIYETASGQKTDATPQGFKIDLLGQDQPGIVYQLTSTLAKMGGNVEALESEVVEASMSGEQLFKASIWLSFPRETDPDLITERLEAIANELIIDIECNETTTK